MQYKAINTILNRNNKDTEEVLDMFSKEIENAVNFGTNLLKWALEKKNVSSSEDLQKFLFFINILELIDSISILIKSSSIDPAKPILRSLLENSYNLIYLLESQTNQRAMSYIVWQINKDLKICNKFDLKNQIGKHLKKKIENDKYINNFDVENSLPHKLIKENLEKLLKTEKYKLTEKEFQDTKQRLKKNSINWYSLYNGPSDMEQLANYLELNFSYETLYREFSENVHTLQTDKNKLIINEKGVSIIEIRYPKDAQKITINCLTIIFLAYSSFYEYLIPEKEKEFIDWSINLKEIFKDYNEKDYII